MTFYLVCLLWLLLSLASALGFGKTIHIADEREPRPERPVLRLI